MRMFKPLLFPLLLVAIPGTLFTLSCENKNEEDLFGITPCDTSDVSWTTDIEPILASKCYHCHYEGTMVAPFSLQGYDNVLIRVNTGQLEGAVNHLPGRPQMPRDGPKLPECELAKINNWIRDGAPNN
jgi:hypothetical protein